MTLLGSVGRWHGNAAHDERAFVTRKITEQEALIASLRVHILASQRDLKAAQRDLHRLQQKHDALPRGAG